MAIRLHSSSAARRARHPLQAPNNRLQRSSQEPPGPHAGRRVPAVDLAMSIRNTPVPEWWRPETWSQHDVASARATTVGERRGAGAWRGGGGLRGAGFGA